VSPKAQKLSDALNALTEDFTEIDGIIFTTFGLSVDFFENCVLGPLAVNQPKLSSAQDVFGASEYCANNNVSVFFDPTATSPVEKRVTFPSYPVFVEDGVFHPKTIIVFGQTGGEPKATLLVGSANISLSGWAKNREVFSTIDISSEATAKPLLEFVRYLLDSQQNDTSELEETYRPLLEYLAETSDVSPPANVPKLHVTLPGEGDSLMSHIAEESGTDVTIFSPYVSPAPSYLCQAAPEGTVTLVPARDESGRLLVEEQMVDRLYGDKSDAISLAQDPRTASDEDYRFSHFKLFGLSDSVIVGSHNATKAALGTTDGSGHRNVEVSVELPGISALQTTPFKDRPDGTPEDDLFAPEDQFDFPLPAAVAVTADWRQEVYRLDLEEPMPEYGIKLPGIDGPIRLDEQSNEVSFTDRARVALLDQKWFEAYQLSANNPDTYRGLINEKNWQTYRKEAAFDSLTACLDAWLSGAVDDPTAEQDHLVSVSEKLLADAEDRAKPSRREAMEDDVFENYFHLFRASEQYQGRLEGAIDSGNIDTGVRLLVSAPGSLERVIELAEQRLQPDDSEWTVYRFIMVQEIKRLLELVKNMASTADELQNVVKRLEPRVRNLVEMVETHPAWSRLEKRTDLEPTVQFLLEEMGYRDG
jgi:hypothetical protein